MLLPEIVHDAGSKSHGRRELYEAYVGYLYGLKRKNPAKVLVDIFRSDAWSCCCTFIFKQAGTRVIDAVCRAVLEAQRAYLTE